jgi:hypothetical protein
MRHLPQTMGFVQSLSAYAEFVSLQRAAVLKKRPYRTRLSRDRPLEFKCVNIALHPGDSGVSLESRTATSCFDAENFVNTRLTMEELATLPSTAGPNCTAAARPGVWPEATQAIAEKPDTGPFL